MPAFRFFRYCAALASYADYVVRPREAFGEIMEEADQQLANVLCILRCPYVWQSFGVVKEVNIMPARKHKTLKSDSLKIAPLVFHLI